MKSKESGLSPSQPAWLMAQNEVFLCNMELSIKQLPQAAVQHPPDWDATRNKKRMAPWLSKGLEW